MIELLLKPHLLVVVGVNWIAHLLRKKLDILKQMQLVSQLERKEEFSQTISTNIKKKHVVSQ